MTGELAQLIAIIAHGNRYMQSGEIEADFFPANSAFQFCNRVTFYQHITEQEKVEPKIIEVADDPVRWMDIKKQEGCRKFKLAYFESPGNPLAPNYMMAGFVGGGGSWLIESVIDDYSLYTNKTWEVTDQHAPDKKIWSVRYDEHPDRFASGAQTFDIPTLALQLEGALTDIGTFARSEGMDYWADKFDKARSTLHQLEPEKHFYHPDLIPAAVYPLAVRQLLFGAAESWVFGGMGWWNDNHFRDQAMYQRLTNDLYGLFNRCVLAAVNSL